MKLETLILRTVTEISHDGYLIVRADADGEILHADDKAQRLLGYVDGELHGLRVDLLIPAELRAGYAEFRAEYLRSPRRIDMAEGRLLRAVRRDGSTIEVQIGLNVVFDGSERVVVVVLRNARGATDATERV